MSDEQPDQFTNAWWQKQWKEVQKGYRGATHGINRCLADYEACWNRLKELGERVDSLETRTREAEAEVGRLKAANERLEDRIEKAGEAFKELRNSVQKGTGSDS